MSYNPYPSHDLLASITSAFDIKSCSEERPPVSTFDNECKDEYTPAKAPTPSDLLSFGHVCGHSHASDSKFNSVLSDGMLFHADPSTLSSVETPPFWSESTSGQQTSTIRSTGKDSRRKEWSKEQQIVKQRYNQTLSFLKKTELYDLTMKVGDFVKRNNQLEKEIESLRLECSGGYCCYSTPFQT